MTASVSYFEIAMAGAAVVTTTVLPVISLVKREFILHLTTKAKCIPVGKMSFEKSRTNQQLEKVASVYLIDFKMLTKGSHYFNHFTLKCNQNDGIFPIPLCSETFNLVC